MNYKFTGIALSIMMLVMMAPTICLRYYQTHDGVTGMIKNEENDDSTIHNMSFNYWMMQILICLWLFLIFLMIASNIRDGKGLDLSCCSFVTCILCRKRGSQKGLLNSLGNMFQELIAFFLFTACLIGFWIFWNSIVKNKYINAINFEIFNQVKISTPIGFIFLMYNIRKCLNTMKMKFSIISISTYSTIVALIIALEYKESLMAIYQIFYFNQV